MTATKTGTTMATDCINFIYENDAGRMLLGLVKHVPHTAGTNANKHLDEIRARNGEERHACFASDGPRQQSFTGTGRTNHQHAARNLAAQLLELAGVLEKIDQLADFLLGFFDARNICKGDLDLIGIEHAGPGFAETHGTPTATAALHLTHEVNPDRDQQKNGKGIEQELQRPWRALGQFASELDVVLDQFLDHGAVVALRTDRFKATTVLELAGDHVAGNPHVRHLPLFDVRQKFGVRQGLLAATARGKSVEYADEHHEDDDPEQQILKQVVQSPDP